MTAMSASLMRPGYAYMSRIQATPRTRVSFLKSEGRSVLPSRYPVESWARRTSSFAPSSASLLASSMIDAEGRLAKFPRMIGMAQ